MFAVGSFSQEPFGFQDGLIKGDPATMSANLTLTANSTRIRLAAMTVSGIASLASAASGTLLGVLGTLSSNLTQTTTGLRIRVAGVGTLSLASTQTSTPTLVASAGTLALDTSVVQSTAGDLKFQEINAGETAETWTEITHTGDTWTEINAGTTAETWTETVN